MSRRDHVIAELQRLARLAMSIQERYSAYLSLHKAAYFNNDPQEIAERRGQIHDTLDSLLDNGEAIHKLSEELQSLPPN